MIQDKIEETGYRCPNVGAAMNSYDAKFSTPEFRKNWKKPGDCADFAHE
jgi:hypothetical protein